MNENQKNFIINILPEESADALRKSLKDTSDEPDYEEKKKKYLLELEKNKKLIDELINKGIDCAKLYEDIKSKCFDIKYVRDRFISLYGLFFPAKHAEMAICKLKGNITKNKDKANFINYFDGQGRVVLMERLDNEKNLLNVIFFVYEKDYIFTAMFNMWQNKSFSDINSQPKLIHVGLINCDNEGRLTRFFDVDVTFLNSQASHQGLSYNDFCYNYKKDVIDSLVTQYAESNGKIERYSSKFLNWDYTFTGFFNEKKIFVLKTDN